MPRSSSGDDVVIADASTDSSVGEQPSSSPLSAEPSVNEAKRHAPRISQNVAPWMRSLSQPASRNEQHHTQVSDHNWTYVYDSKSIGIPIKGFGNVPIASYENIAKMCDRRLNVCCVTWNINEKNVKILQHLTTEIKTIKCAAEYDMITIALQEIPPSSKTFHEDALKILSPAFKEYSLYFSHRAWTQMLMIFIRRHHLRFAIEPHVSFVPSAAIAKPVRTKGAIAISFRLYQRWIVVIGSHLSHASSQQRVQDYQKIAKSLRFPTLKKFNGSEDLFSADVVFWTGDLNFRFPVDPCIDWYREADLDAESFSQMIEKDELHIFRSKGIAFTEFAETPIGFAPTHKFVIGTNDYVPKRIPSFTDRVLFWTRNVEWLQGRTYDCIRGEHLSDHRAVYCTFSLNVINKPIPKRFYSNDQFKVDHPISSVGCSTVSLPTSAEQRN